MTSRVSPGGVAQRPASAEPSRAGVSLPTCLAPDATPQAIEELLSRAAERAFLRAVAATMRPPRPPEARELRDDLLRAWTGGQADRMKAPRFNFLVEEYVRRESATESDAIQKLRDELGSGGAVWPREREEGATRLGPWPWLTLEQDPVLARAVERLNAQVRREAARATDAAVAAALGPPPTEIAEAVTLLAQTPTSFAAMQSLIAAVCPVRSRMVVGFTSETLPRVVFVGVGHGDALWYAERLVHESAHSKLHLVAAREALVEAGDSPVYDSPWREDKRTVSGILHGTYVNWHVVRFFDELMRSGASPAGVAPRRQAELQRVRRGLQVLGSVRMLTELGAAVVDAIERDLRSA